MGGRERAEVDAIENRRKSLTASRTDAQVRFQAGCPVARHAVAPCDGKQPVRPAPPKHVPPARQAVMKRLPVCQEDVSPSPHARQWHRKRAVVAGVCRERPQRSARRPVPPTPSTQPPRGICSCRRASSPPVPSRRRERTAGRPCCRTQARAQFSRQCPAMPLQMSPRVKCHRSSPSDHKRHVLAPVGKAWCLP